MIKYMLIVYAAFIVYHIGLCAHYLIKGDYT